ncbi:MAG: hypothetical protein Q9201_006307 [Fulgogasparrea decipioides]
MPSSEALTDDYLAELLAKDARDRTIKYSSYGLQASLPKRPTTNAPKPNTRFLKNIIKETDNHNASLRAKEIADARARLRTINGDSGREEQHGHWDTRRRRDEDGRAFKRRRVDRITTKITAVTTKPSAHAIVNILGEDAVEAQPQTLSEANGKSIAAVAVLPQTQTVLGEKVLGIDTGHAQDRRGKNVITNHTADDLITLPLPFLLHLNGL